MTHKHSNFLALHTLNIMTGEKTEQCSSITANLEHYLVICSPNVFSSIFPVRRQSNLDTTNTPRSTTKIITNFCNFVISTVNRTVDRNIKVVVKVCLFYSYKFPALASLVVNCYVICHCIICPNKCDVNAICPPWRIRKRKKFGYDCR